MLVMIPFRKEAAEKARHLPPTVLLRICTPVTPRPVRGVRRGLVAYLGGEPVGGDDSGSVPASTGIMTMQITTIRTRTAVSAVVNYAAGLAGSGVPGGGSCDMVGKQLGVAEYGDTRDDSRPGI